MKLIEEIIETKIGPKKQNPVNYLQDFMLQYFYDALLAGSLRRYSIDDFINCVRIDYGIFRSTPFFCLII